MFGSCRRRPCRECTASRKVDTMTSCLRLRNCINTQYYLPTSTMNNLRPRSSSKRILMILLARSMWIVSSTTCPGTDMAIKLNECVRILYAQNRIRRSRSFLWISPVNEHQTSLSWSDHVLFLIPPSMHFTKLLVKGSETLDK